MISIKTRHFNFNRILLLAIGLWPYQRSKLVGFQMILLLSILMSFIVFQFTTFLTMDLSLKLIINVLSSVLCFVIFVVNYCSFWINSQNVRYLLEQFQHIYNELRDENEIAIIERYGSNAKRFTLTISLLTMCSLFFLFTEPFWLRILEVFLFVNQSRPDSVMHVVTEYFVDQEEYFYLILLHMNTAICIGVTVTMATGSMIVGYVKCACGMFSIASYRIEQALANRMLKNINSEKDIMISKQIFYAVDIHRKAMQFTEFLTSSFEGYFFFLITVTVIGMSLNLYGVALFMEDIAKLLPLLVRVLGILFCMFMGNYVGQEITDHNNHVFFSVYNVRWYKAPLHIQKLILFLLQRGNKAFTLHIGGLFVSSLDGFATMASASISYFTVIYSTQQ